MEPDEYECTKRARVATETDLVLVCSGNTRLANLELVHTHRNKLVEVSPVFAAMLKGEWAESEEGMVRVFFESEIVKIFIEQISAFPPELKVRDSERDRYGEHLIVGKIEYPTAHTPYLHQAQIEKLCEMAQYYDVRPLSDKLHEFLIKVKRTPNTVKPLFELAVLYDFHHLKLKCAESVTSDPVYFLFRTWPDHPDWKAMDNLALLSYSEFQPAWQKLVEFTDPCGSVSSDSRLPKVRKKYVAPPMDALDGMMPFMRKCFNHPPVYSQLPNGWRAATLLFNENTFGYEYSSKYEYDWVQYEADYDKPPYGRRVVAGYYNQKRNEIARIRPT